MPQIVEFVLQNLWLFIILMVVFKGNFRLIIKVAVELVKLVFRLLFALLGLIFEAGKKSQKRPRRQQPVQAQQPTTIREENAYREKAQSNRVRQASAEVPTKSNPWASGNPGQRANPFAHGNDTDVIDVSYDDYDHDLPETPKAEQVKDRAADLPDDTVIVRHDIAETKIPNYKKRKDRTRRKVEILLRPHNVKSAFVFKELLDKPLSLRD